MKKHRLLANILIVLLITASLLTLVSYGLPVFLKPKILELIEQKTGKKATLDTCQFTLMPLAIQLQNIKLPENNGKPFASINRAYAEINIWESLSISALVIEELTIKNPVVHIVKQKNGKFNFEDLFKNQPDKQSDTLGLPFNIVKLSLSEGILTWDDSSNKETIQPIELTVNNLSTFTDKKSQLNLQLSLASGGNLNWKGELGLNPLISDGHLTLKNLKLNQPMLPASLPFSLSGHALIDSDYKARYGKQGFELSGSKAKIELRDFQYAEKKKNPIVVKTAYFNHETDFKLTYADNSWLLTSQKAKINIRNFDYSDPTQPKTLIKIPNLTSESDFKLQSLKQHLQLSANKLRMSSQNLELQFANSKFKTPAISLETAIDNIFSDNTQVILHRGKLNSHHVQLFDKTQDKPLIDINELAVNGVNFDLTKQSLNIDAINADNADARVALTSKGTNYQTLFNDDKTDKPEVKSNPVSTKPTPSSPPWAIKINQINLTQWGAHFEDQTQHNPVIINFKPANLKLTGYNNKAGVKLPFQLNTVINTTGSMRLDGTLIIDPFAIQMAVEAKAIELEPFQPYLEHFAHLDIIDGKLSTTGTLAVSTPENQPLDLKFTGDSSIVDLITRDQKRHRDFIKWKTLNLKAFAADLRKDSYTADALVIDKPYVKVTIRKNKTLNFSDVFIDRESQTPAKSSDKPINPHPRQTYFKLNKLQIIDGSSDFADRSLILPFTTQIQSLDGGANDISSDQKSTIKVSLKGNVYDLSPVDIDGYINPYSGNYDLNVNFKGMPMPLISSYMVEFAGYKIEKGKMTLKLKYKVVDDILSASNNIEIDQFELGEQVDNPKAVSLPMEMAIALLKDADGKINIDVPITGSLNDPQFDIGAIISNALSNAISKVVTSPFHALAGLVSDDASISNISFKAGNAVLDQAQQDKLTAIAKLLKERSALALDIKATAFEVQDWAAIQEATLYESIKKIRAQEMNKQNSVTKTQLDQIELSDADYKRLLAEEFIAKFPKLAKKSFFGTPELIDTKGDFYEVAKQYLRASLKSENYLKALAVRRAQTIANFLVKKNSVSNEQVFILSPVIDPQRDNKEINTILSLKPR